MTGTNVLGNRFGKPSMTDLPYELGRSIIDTIMNTPAPDFSDTNEEIDRTISQIKEGEAARHA